MPAPRLRHDSSTYNNYACRCERCKQSKMLYMREWRKRKRLEKLAAQQAESGNE